MARLLTRTRTRLAVKRTATKQKSRFQTKKRTHLAGVIAGGLAVVDGQLYGTGADSAGVIDVVNLGRAAAALYVPENGSGSVTLAGGSGSCSDGGSGGVGVHALDGPYHTGTLAQSQAPWAALDSDLQDHIADDIHHERLHNILNTDDHEVTAARYSVLGTPNAANALAMWLTDEDGTPGNVLLRSDNDGNARLNALFAYNRVQSQSFASGFGGNGYRLDYGVTTSGRSTLEVDNVSIRGRLTVRELLIRKIRTTNGDIFVSSGGTVQSVTEVGGGYWDLVFKEDAGLLEDDLIAAQAWTGAGVYRIEATVTAVTDSTHIRILVNSGDDPDDALAAANSLDFARHGSTSDTDRQGLIYLTSDDTGGPFIRVVDGIDSWADWGTADVLKVQLGQLDGITDATLGDLSGYGLYGQNVYLTGILAAGGGDAVLGDDGLNIQAGTSSDGGWTNHSDKLTFAEDPMATLDDGNVIGQLGANRFVSGSDVVRRVAMRVNAGADSSTDQARIGLEAYWIDAEADVPIQSAAIQMIGEEGAPSISLSVQGATSNAGTISLTTPVLNVSGHIRMTNGGDIGTALAPVGTLYADELVVGTTYTNNTGFVNDIRYYPRTELNTYLDNTFEQLGHSHPGLVTSAELTDTLADYATIAYVDAEIAGIPAPDLSNYWTKAQADGRYTQATTYNGHVAAANPHGTALADLTARDYDDLTNRGHLLADAVGLGPDHTIGAAAAGHVLRATDTDAARFMQLLYTDLGSRTHDIIEEHSVTAAQYSVIGTPAGADTLAAWATTTNGRTNTNTILRSGSGGEVTVGALSALAIDGTTGNFSDDVTVDGDLDITGTYSGLFGTIQGGATLNIYGDTIQFGTQAGVGHVALLSDGTLRSASYASSLGDSGWELGEAGQNLSNVYISGSLASTLIEYKSRIVGGGGQIWRPAGKLKADLTIDDKPYRPDPDGGAVPGVFPTYTIHMENPALGKIQIADVDDVLMIQALARNVPQTQTSNSANWARDYWRIQHGYTDAGLLSKRSRFVVTAVTDEGDYYSYDVKLVEGGGNYTYPAGTGVVVDGGGVQVVADEPHAPYLDVYRLANDTDPFANYDQYLYRHNPIVRLGLLSGLAEGSAGEYGLLIRGGQEVESNGFTVDTGAYFKGSGNGVELVNGNVIMRPSDYFWGDGTELTLDSINGLRFTIGELVDDEIGNDAMSIDWYHADDDPGADPYLLRIDANPSGDRTIHAQGRAVTSALEYEDGDTGAAVTETSTITKSTLAISSETTDTANFTGNSAVRQAQLILETQHSKAEYSGGVDDGLIELSKFSRATLSADNIIIANPYSEYSQYGLAIQATFGVKGGLIFLRDLPTSALDLPAGAIYMDEATGALMVAQ